MIKISEILPKRPSEKPEGAASYKLDMDKRINALALNSLKAAVEAINGLEKKNFKLPNSKNQPAFSINLSPEKATIPEEAKKLEEGCLSLFHILEAFKKRFDTPLNGTPIITAKDLQFIRKEIHNLLQLIEKTPAAVFNDQDLQPTLANHINFLQHLSYQINTQSAGMEVFEEVGESILNLHLSQTADATLINDNSKVSLSKISEWTNDIFNRLDADNWDSLKGHIIWILKNLLKFIQAQIDNCFASGHKYYNAYQLGNLNTWIGTFKVNHYNKVDDKIEIASSKEIDFNLGPSATSDSLFKAQLEYQKANKMHHIQHNLETPNTKRKEGERARTIEQLKLAGINNDVRNDTFSLIMTCLDGDIRKGKGIFSDIKSVKDFHDKLASIMLSNDKNGGKLHEELKGYKGFFTGLSEIDLNGVLKTSTEAFQAIIGSGEFEGSDKASNRRLCRLMLLEVIDLIAVKTLLNCGTIEKVKFTMSQPCKQDVDRGPIVNTTTISSVQLINNGHLKGKDFKRMLGILVSRALMVDGRKMNKDRLEGFLDLFSTIGRNEKAFVDKLQDFAGKSNENPNPIMFTPSHEIKR